MTDRFSNLTFRPEGENDADDVLALYRSLVGTPFCAWDDTYPGMEHILSDIRAHALYGVRDGKELIAAGAVRHWTEHDNLVVWTSSNPCDLLRLGVKQSRQGHGLGGWFFEKLRNCGRAAGHDAIRILVAQTNVPAMKLYRRAGARFRGTSFSYGIDWFCYELNL